MAQVETGRDAVARLSDAELLDAARKTLDSMSYANEMWLVCTVRNRRKARASYRRTEKSGFDAYCDICEELQARGIVDQFSDWEAVAAAARKRAWK